MRSVHVEYNLKTGHFMSLIEREWLRNLQNGKVHVQSVQNYSFSLLIMQIRDVLVAVVVIQGPVCRKSRNFSGLFWVPQFPLYLRNTEVLSHQTSQSSWFFLH